VLVAGPAGARILTADADHLRPLAARLPVPVEVLTL
jgi:hypothetical protein